MDHNVQVTVQELDPPTRELLVGLFKGKEFTRFGIGGNLLPVGYKVEADDFRHMALRPDDLWVVTFPRSGTTWTQELVWLLKNDLDYDAASKKFLRERYAFLEVAHVRNPEHEKPELLQIVTKLASTSPSLEALARAPSPRFFRTHLSFSLLPQGLLDTAKVVYVARDPRDVVVSYYHFSKHFHEYQGDFRTFWHLFINDLVMYSPFFHHVKEAWALRNHKNMLFIFYEDMTKDLASSIRRFADFLGKEITNEELVTLCDHLHIDTFRNNKSVNFSVVTEKLGDPKAFIRNGKSGTWHLEFDDEMAAQAQSWLNENLADTDLRFPSHDL